MCAPRCVRLGLWMATAVAHTLVAQAPGVPSYSAYQVNFAVPDAPAFLLLDVDPSTMLRPQTVRELSVALAQFRTPTGSFALPRSAAIEFSPGLLLTDRRLTAASYQKRKLLYATRISFATGRDSATGAPTRLAFGLRFTLANEADFRTDSAYPAELGVTALNDTIAGVYSAARDRVGPRALLVLSPDEQENVDRLRQEIRDRWAVRYWNADILDVALAFRGQAADSTGRDPQLDAFAAWGTYAKGLGRWGQALFGVRMGAARDSVGGSYRQSASLAARLYAGANRGKAFLEVEQRWQENATASWLFNSGLELELRAGIWAVFSLGVEQPGGVAPRSRATFKLNTTLPS